MRVVKVFHWLLVRVIALIMIALLLFSGYAIWSNHRGYVDAKDVYNNVLQLKPEDNNSTVLGFADLKQINPDICGWITLADTNIDYPIVQGRNNLEYMNQDVYGNFSLAGCIFLDTRNRSDFKDSYSLVYGHHMSNHMMFGDLDMFKDQKFFETNRSATLTTETDVKEMSVLAVLEIPDSSAEIFDPTMWGADLTELARYIKEHSLYVWKESMTEIMENPQHTQALALATCSDGATGNRTVIILIAHRENENPDIPGVAPDRPNDEPAVPNISPDVPQTGDMPFGIWFKLLIISFIGLSVNSALMIRQHRTRKRKS